MEWELIFNAAIGHSKSLNEFLFRGPSINDEALIALLLQEEAPSAPAALVAAAGTLRQWSAPLILAALAPHAAPALAAWRADPLWPGRAIGAAAMRWAPQVVVEMVGALRAHPAALRDAVAIALRDGNHAAVACRLDALGAAGWRALEDDQRGALLARAAPDDLGRVWAALDETQRAATAQRAEGSLGAAARLIRSIGAAWKTTDPALRRRLIDAVERNPKETLATAPTWSDMTDDERERLATTVIEHGNAESALTLLRDLGPAGRAALTADRRAALEARVPAEHAMDVLALRAADDGWDALTKDERGAVLAMAERDVRTVPRLLRIVGGAGWNAMQPNDRRRLAAVVRRRTTVLFACPPALWPALTHNRLPPTTRIPYEIIPCWRAEDADADLSGLSEMHQALVLALARWRQDDVAPTSVRLRRLCAAWNAMSANERMTFVLAHRFAAPAVAAAVRLRGDAASVAAAVGATIARVVTATGGAAIKRDVASMLRTFDAWRPWTAVFAPTDADPPDVWAAWDDAAQRGYVLDSAICMRLAAKRRTPDDSGALRRVRGGA